MEQTSSMHRSMPHIETKGIIMKAGQFLTEHIAIRAILATLLTWMISLFGDLRQGHIALLILITLDTLTGIWVAGAKGRISSSKLFSATFRKIIIYMIFLIAVHQAVSITELLLWMRDWGILFLAVTELISVIENLHTLGFILPKWVSVKLQKILDKNPYE